MDAEEIRQDFPILQKKIAYFDSACMSLKPRQVVEAMNKYYIEFPACGERSSHKLGNRVTQEYETARKRIAKFIGAKEEEIIFTKNTTEGVNLIANSLGLGKDDIVITSDKEHNSNFLPWMKYKHTIIRTINGSFDSAAFDKTINNHVKVVSVVHTSNIDGRTFQIEKIAKTAHNNGALFIVDGAQSVPHKEIDVKKIGCDALSFSGHKMLGPSIGCLYIKKDLAEKISPIFTGGGTIQKYENGKPIFLNSPHKFEAGLQNYAGALGLRAAVEYLESVGLKNIEKHEILMNKIMSEGIEDIKNVEIIGGTPEERGGILSFNIKGIDSKEAALMLDSFDVLVRGGFHCCHNWFNFCKINGSIRASIYLYNNERDAQMFVDAVKKIALLAKK